MLNSDLRGNFPPARCPFASRAAKVQALRLTTWRYKADSAGATHMGPVAQDFFAAFGLGVDDKHIATVDADGVALAAIQGLNARLVDQLRDKDARIARLQERVALNEARDAERVALKQQVAELMRERAVTASGK